MTAVILALAASVSFGASNFIAGLESRRRSVWTVTAVSQVASALSAGVFIAFAHRPFLTAGPAIWSVVAGAAAAGGILALYRALALGAMSVVSPIIALQVAIPVLVGVSLGERPTAIAYFGMVVAVAGVALVSRTKGGHSQTPRTAILLAILTAALFGIMLVGIDQAGDGDRYWVVFMVRLASACVVLLFVAGMRRRLDAPARTVPGMVLVGVLLTGATLFFSAAVAIGSLSIVSVLGSLSPVVTTALAQVFLHERLGRLQWAGVVAVLIGIMLLTT